MCDAAKANTHNPLLEAESSGLEPKQNIIDPISRHGVCDPCSDRLRLDLTPPTGAEPKVQSESGQDGLRNQNQNQRWILELLI